VSSKEAKRAWWLKSMMQILYNCFVWCDIICETEKSV
jgi:hypothetical protein